MNYNKEKIEELQHRWTTTKGKKLIKTVKNSRCYLSPVLFRQKVHNFPGINDEEVIDDVDLRGIPLSGFDFRVPIEEDDGYSESVAILSNIHFEGAILKSCNFQNAKLYDCKFDNAELSHSEFNNTTFNTCSFQEADLTAVNFHSAKLVDCSFVEANLKDLVLDKTIVDEKSNFGKELKSEKGGNLHFASIEYKQIKEMYKNSSLHNIADHFHYKEMVAKRKIASKKSPTRWLNFIFGDLLCKYGTSYYRVIAWAMAFMAFCAGLYTNHETLLYQNEVITPSFATSLYFSIVTFTTLGYGDYHPIGALRYLAAVESFIGAAIMALFTVIVARHIIRD